jgi:uncharacterized protein YcbK (DUF882 family)
MKLLAMREASLTDHRLNRRRFLGWGALAAGMSLIPQAAVARRSTSHPPRKPLQHPPRKPLQEFKPPETSPRRSLFQAVSNQPEKAVALYNTHTGESIHAVYWFRGRYLPEAMSAVDRVLRDHRTDEVKPIDPQLLDLLYAIRGELECSHPFYVISGYRSPTTNAYLRFMSRRVAEHSLHMDGKAIDLRIPGWASDAVRRVAMELRMGGVGYYPRSNFVHVDVGPVRYW